MPKFIDRTSEKRMMKCGLEAEITVYRNSRDIDLRFSDGQISKHKPYASFRACGIAPPIDPRKTKHIGEKNMMGCGMTAEIIRWNNNSDIDVRFEDGQITEHRLYYSFKKGQIAPPIDSRKINRIGEKRTMNCGLEAEIIRYGRSDDIDVRFENGQEIFYRTYNQFQKGQIAPPKKTRVGERQKMNCGLEAEIIRYGGCNDIDVRFEDGQEVHNREYNSFRKRTISPPNDPRFPSHIGERRMMNCGLEATIIRYGNSQDIDVQFSSGETVTNRDYYGFCKGKISPPIKSRLGERRMMNCGLMAEIIVYRSCEDIDVRFKDGQIVEHKSYSTFKIRSIAPPIDPRNKDHTGEKKIMNCGLEAEIIRYGGYKDIDVRFEDGQERFQKTYSNFKKGRIAHPSFSTQKSKTTHFGTLRISYRSTSPEGEAFYYCKCQKCGFETIDTARNIIKLEHKCETQPTEEGEN